MKPSFLGAAFLAGNAFAGPVPVQTLAARDATSYKARLAAPVPYKRSPSPAVFTPFMVRRQDEAESPLPTATDCSLVTSDPSELVYTSLGTVPEEDQVITTTLEGGPGCECANGVMAGIYTTIGDDGGTTSYCATSTALSSGAVATATETGTPGDPNNAAWSEVSCSDGSLKSADNNPWTQWNDSGASAAFEDVKNAWADSGVDSFPDFLADFFHTRPDISCDVLDNSNCEVTINCGEGLEEANAPVSAPAGYVIVNSLINLHSIYENLYHGINDALTQVTADVGTYVDALSPIGDDIEEQQREKLILDGVQTALVLVAAPTFHGAATRLSAVASNPNVAAMVFDISYGIIGTSMGFAKDAMESLSPLPVQNEMSSYFANTTQQWLTALSDMNRNIFNDPDALLTIIDRGQLFASDADDDPVDLINQMKKTLFAAGIRAVWMSGEVPNYPVLIRDTDIPQDGSGCESYNPANWESDEDAESFFLIEGDDESSQEETGASTRICDGDHAFFLMGAYPEVWETTCSTGAQEGDLVYKCTQKSITLSKLKGYDDLDGSQFGGLTKEDVAWNAINMWKAVGEKNAFDSSWNGMDSTEEMDAMISGDLKKTKGIVNIPVCGMQEMMDTFLDDNDNSKGNPNYPCPA